MIARVALSDIAFSADKLYDYSIPDRLAAEAAEGKRVSVPFAMGNRRREGMVFELADSSSLSVLKPIDAWLDDRPVMSRRQTELARWMKSRFFCTYYDAVRAMLPAGVWLKGECMCSICTDRDAARQAAEEQCGESGREMLEAVIAAGGSMKMSDLKDIFGADAESTAAKLEAAGAVKREMDSRRRGTDKTARTAVLEISGEEAAEAAGRKKRTAKQQAELLRVLAAVGSADVKELQYFTGASMQSINALEKAGYISIQTREVYRRPEYTESDKPVMTGLNAQQQRAYEGIRPLLDSTKAAAALLYGVTGSGKTAVYISLISDVVSAGGQAIVLVPEIALTPQLTALFYRHFGENVAVLHSSLTVGERYDEWKRIRAGEVDVVVGTRSAVFAPVERLKLLIIDEEQEHTYKSENSPRYHARDVAKYRCVESGALLLLGSATPSVESMYSARQGKYHLFTMTERYNTKPLPQVLIADMKQELKDGNGTSISRLLYRELKENINRGEQSILFINRRGASSAVTCPECGYTFSCPKCSAKLTYHSANRRVMCHYCGFSQRLPGACPECGGILSHSGAGTQKVEDELRQLLGEDVGILRMDADTVSASRPHEAILDRFEKERIPILIGTQMITKGLNFPNVTLVGVINADQALYCGHYRAGEQTFSLITQVVGRSGRGEKSGRAVIQTFTPNNEIILCAARQDYDAFYQAEIQIRELLGAPPIRELYTVTVSGEDERIVLKCCGELCAALESSTGFRVLGPAPAAIVKVNNRYRYRVILNAEPSREARALITAAVKKYSADRKYRSLFIFGDVNPME